MPNLRNEQPFSDEELERQQATDLPDREALSVMAPGVMTIQPVPVPPTPIDQPMPVDQGPVLDGPPPTDTLQPIPESPLGATPE